MNKIKRILSLLLIFSFYLSITGCTGKNEERNIIYNTTTLIDNIDPQLADNETELQIVYNTFEGLFKYDENSKIVKGVVEEYKISQDGLTYEFKIRDDAKWANGENLLAEDFEFGLTRAVDKKINSPYSYTLLPIKNVEKILAGKLSASEIGVKAISDKKLKIYLDYPTTELLKILTMPVSMPCNKEFYEDCKGYYGLNDETVLSNGFYSVSNWNEEYCSLLKNEEYIGAKSLNTAVYIYFNTDDEFIESIDKNEVDFSIITNLVNSSEKTKTLDTIKVSDTTYSLFINKQSNIAQSDILKALTNSISFEITEEIKNINGVAKTNKIAPKILNNASEINGLNSKKYSKSKLQSMFLDGCEALDIELSMPPINIIYPANYISEDITKQIAAKWQLLYGVTINIEGITSLDDLEYRIDNGYFDAAVFPSVAVNDSAELFYGQFSKNYPNNFIGYRNSEFERNLKRLGRIKNKTKIMQKLNNKLIQNKYIIPLYTTSKLYYIKEETDIFINKKNKIAYFYY